MLYVLISGVLMYLFIFVFGLQRGVYFEITYSGLIMDAQVRRQMISNAKVRVEIYFPQQCVWIEQSTDNQ